MSLDGGFLGGLHSTISDALRKIFNDWLPSATLTWTNKTITGVFTGPVTGAVTGDVAGDVTGDLNLPAADARVASADLGDTDFLSSYITLNGTSACAISNWTPTVGRVYHLHCVTSVSNSPTVALSSGGTWDDSADLATFDATDEFITVICVAALTLKVIANPNSIAFS